MKTEKKEGAYCIRCLCIILYLMYVLNVMGISVNMNDTSQADAKGTADGYMEEKSAGKIAITFDDGPNGKYTGKLLDGLKERDVKATFFLIGRYVKEHPELAERISKEGHLIGNHTYNHIAMNQTSEEEVRKELEKASDVIYKVTGEYPQYMRAPYGACSRQLEDSLDMIMVRWTIDPLDWNHETTDEIVKKVVTKAEENDIILLHDCYEASVDAALRIVDILQERGFEFVTVDELYMN